MPVLHGETCIRASCGYAGALLLDFGLLHPADARGYREPELFFVAECPWRLETATEVLTGYFDDDDRQDERLQRLIRQRVVKTTVTRPSFTVEIVLTDSLRLWVFPCDVADYTAQSDYPLERQQSPWFVGGRALINLTE